MVPQKTMEGKRVLVTGSGTGIGRGVALEFAAEGASVALHYAHSEEGARSAVEEIRGTGGKAEAFKADLADLDQVQGLAVMASDFLGGIDVLDGPQMLQVISDVCSGYFFQQYDQNVRLVRD